MSRLINARYSLPAWLWAIVSTLFGVFIFFYVLTDPAEVRNFTGALPFEGYVWSPLVIIAGICAMYGMAKNKIHLIRRSSFTAFMLWLFGDISWIISSDDGWVNVFIFGAWMTVFWLYKYLASYARERENI